ncbi:MalM family protein [Shigella flexneri]
MPNVTTYRKNAGDAPAIPSAALQQLAWTPVNDPKTQTTRLATGGQQLSSGVGGPVAGAQRPANIGELTLTLTSEVNNKPAFCADVLILKSEHDPSAFFPSGCFHLPEAGVMSADRLEGVMRLTPALGAAKSLCSCLYHEKISSRRPNCSTR